MGRETGEWSSYVTPAGDVIQRNWRNFMAGTIPFEELDNEEISRMRMRDDNGIFTGPKPIISRKQAADFRRELHRRVEEKLQEKTIRMFEVIADVADSSASTGAERTRAAQYLIERALGKVPDKVEVTAEVKPWEGTVAGILQDITEDEEMKEIEGAQDQA